MHDQTFLQSGQVWDGGPYPSKNAARRRRITAIEESVVHWLDVKGGKRRTQLRVFETWVRERRAKLIEGESRGGYKVDPTQRGGRDES